MIPLKLVYGVQDALVRDTGGSVQDANECRTTCADQCVFGGFAVVFALVVVMAAVATQRFFT